MHTVTQALSTALNEQGLKFFFLDSDDSWVAEADFNPGEAPPKSPVGEIFVRIGYSTGVFICGIMGICYIAFA